jgi:hypothetical protein
MQTFLPFSSYSLSAQCLDDKRLGKQRVECKQILSCILGTSCLGWKHHPAVIMWQDYGGNLCLYTIQICLEWRLRGFKDSIMEWTVESMVNFSDFTFPHWLGLEEFHRSHRSNLVRKNPNHYTKYFQGMSYNESEAYVWPVAKEQAQ